MSSEEEVKPATTTSRGRGPAWIWTFVLTMTIYNALKYPIIMRSGPENPYAISSILGGGVLAATPKWFLLWHVPLMVASNFLAASIGFGWKRLDHNRLAYLTVVLLETANALLVILPPAKIYAKLGSMGPHEATIANFGAIVPVIALLWLSMFWVSKRFSLFAAAFFFKCFLITGGEFGSLFKHMQNKH